MTKVYCGNNELAPQLKRNGGDREFGTTNQCFEKGYAKAMNQEIKDMPEFIKHWSAKYKPHIVQQIYYGSNKMPPHGYQQATLVQHMQRGYVLGCKARVTRFTTKYHNENIRNKTPHSHEVPMGTFSRNHDDRNQATSSQ